MKITVTFLLLLSLLLSFSISVSASVPDEVKWSNVNIPADGRAGSWVLANGSDIGCLNMAADGTLYCYANPAGTSYRLFKSSDGGYSWSYTGKVEDTIVDIAVMPSKPNIIYYATSSKIYKSTDAGATFMLAALNPAGSGSGNLGITSIDVNSVESGNIIAIGTRDTDAGQFGGVYICEESKSATWTDTGIGNCDVCELVFSPNYTADRQLVAVVTDETNTVITASINHSMWNSTAGNAIIPGSAAVSAAIAFPADYSSEVTGTKYVQFVAINTGSGGGDVFQINGKPAPAPSKITDLNAGITNGLSSVDFTGLAVSGNGDKAFIMAGTTASAQVYLSTDSGKNWARSNKPATGGGKTLLLMAKDFSQSGVAYAATSGAESAFSVTRDRGLTWNQTGLIDTAIASIIDLGVSPDFETDNTVFMLTFGGKHSLWRSNDGAPRWERVYSGALAGVNGINLAAISPQYTRYRSVLVAGTSAGKPAFWKSADGGQSFTKFTSTDPVSETPLNIDTWVIAPDNSLFIGSFDGTNGVVCRNTGNAPFYADKGIAGTTPLSSIALSPNLNEDRNLLVGNTTGWVYLSDDNGISFQTIPPGASSAPLTGSVTVAFDPAYNQNKTVYAASDGADKGIYRFIIGKGTGWERIDKTTLPAGGKIGDIAVSPDGMLYGCNYQAVDTGSGKGGIERSLDPNYPLGPTFETVTRGLGDGASLAGLHISGNRLWAIDLANVKLLTYVDSLAGPVALTSPANKSPGVNTRNLKLAWKALAGATKYRWQIDRDTDFSSIPAGFEGDSEGISAGLPALETDTTYYWRVRATEPVLSQWSARWSFNTSLAAEAAAPRLTSPEAAAGNVPLKPIFQWRAMAGAERYELLLSDDHSFANPLVAKTGKDALPATAWQCDIALKYGTTYYWKVRAVNSNNSSDWSAAGAFVTEAAPVPPAPPAATVSVLPPIAISPPPSPSPVPMPVVLPQAQVPAAPSQTPDNLMLLIYLGIGILLVLLVLLVILVIIMLKLFRRQFF